MLDGNGDLVSCVDDDDLDSTNGPSSVNIPPNDEQPGPSIRAIKQTSKLPF